MLGDARKVGRVPGQGLYWHTGTTKSGPWHYEAPLPVSICTLTLSMKWSTTTCKTRLIMLNLAIAHRPLSFLHQTFNLQYQ